VSQARCSSEQEERITVRLARFNSLLLFFLVTSLIAASEAFGRRSEGGRATYHCDKLAVIFPVTPLQSNAEFLGGPVLASGQVPWKQGSITQWPASMGRMFPVCPTPGSRFLSMFCPTRPAYE
jgi:hypothetical protein